MTRGNVTEYIEAVREPYMRDNHKEKGNILDEATRVIEYDPISGGDLRW